MKSINSILVAMGIAFSATFLSGDPVHNKKLTTIPTDSTIYNKLDSLDNVRMCYNEKVADSLEADNKIFQKTRKELLHLDLCLDSVHSLELVESDSNIVLPTIK